MAWTDERVDLLKKLWAEGLSASQIASKMGGVTRNAVIGKVHRLGLSGRATPAKPQRGRINEGTRAAAPRSFAAPKKTFEADENEPEFLEPLVLDGGDMATVSTLNKNMCKWPVGDPTSEEFHFCGQSAQSGKPYCAYHAHMAFQPSHTTRKERPRPQQRILAQRKVG
ncbi:hypothetical protein FF098_016115 [Parvularcula flava]|uniref:Cell cycle regulatory protein GcrA n=1 Tax=Aquisalinus luteolus TaxID=1566827 RepID=A0A8J3ESQ8_9PROT|nr:GcrA family cell cycle regulator [Aquisalinus luteolus]NHK29439.1 hypothetical protein [Aquisalinus luteolus]GGI01949.1 cell cycle regulatory protein GcrA [Aquisalinus luteolus]